jgi:drug/metabolite transporter (DMT)-like permease
VAIFIGSLFADELLTPRILASALIVVSSVVLINWGRRVISDK